MKATSASITHGGPVACYNRLNDAIRMPKRSSFVGSPTSTPQVFYYSTELHEIGHWTGHASRLDLEFGKRFGDNADAVEELTAELTAAFLCAKLGVSPGPAPGSRALAKRS